jgi:hypothetical protein
MYIIDIFFIQADFFFFFENIDQLAKMIDEIQALFVNTTKRHNCSIIIFSKRFYIKIEGNEFHISIVYTKFINE